MKKMKLTSEQVQVICNALFDDITKHNFQIYRTKGGNVAVIFSRKAGGTVPLLGAYYTSNSLDGEWIPSRWTEQGQFNADNMGPLDLAMVQYDEPEAA